MFRVFEPEKIYEPFKFQDYPIDLFALHLSKLFPCPRSIFLKKVFIVFSYLAFSALLNPCSSFFSSYPFDDCSIIAYLKSSYKHLSYESSIRFVSE